MQVVSVVSERGYDVIEQLIQTCKTEKLFVGSFPAYQEKLIAKIVSQLHQFIDTQMIPDGYRVVCLEDIVYEFRISLPGTKSLARIVFVCERNHLILLTGSLTKPVSYHDTKTKQATDESYKNSVENARHVYTDWMGKQLLSYTLIEIPL